MKEGLRVVLYLKDTKDLALQLGGKETPIVGMWMQIMQGIVIPCIHDRLLVSGLRGSRCMGQQEAKCYCYLHC